MNKPKPKQRYNNLAEFRDYLVANNLETIVRFTGWELVTKRRRYWMVNGEIHSEPRGRGRQQ